MRHPLKVGLEFIQRKLLTEEFYTRRDQIVAANSSRQLQPPTDKRSAFEEPQTQNNLQFLGPTLAMDDFDDDATEAEDSEEGEESEEGEAISDDSEAAPVLHIGKEVTTQDVWNHTSSAGF